MKVKFAWLRLAALIGSACAFPTAFAADLNVTFTLTWTSPTQNADGSPLTDLQGYYVYVGWSPEDMWPLCFTAEQSIVLNHRVPGPKYFAVAAINSSGVESALSEALSAPVEAP